MLPLSGSGACAQGWSPVPLLRFSLSSLETQDQTVSTGVVLRAWKRGKDVFFEIKANFCLSIQQKARVVFSRPPLIGVCLVLCAGLCGG